MDVHAFDTREKAEAEISEPIQEDDEDDIECDSPDGALVASHLVPLLTEKGNARARGYGMDSNATQMAVMFWAEDVLRQTYPAVIGVWWTDDYDPASLRAPAGAVFPSCVGLLDVIEADDNDDDEELLDAMKKRIKLPMPIPAPVPAPVSTLCP